VEPRKPETRLQGRVGNDAIAEYSTGSSYARACKVIGREARRCGACPWRRKGPPGEMAGSERSYSATADTRAADKTRTPTTASEAPSAASDVPTESTASAATTAWTGFRYAGDRGNCEEHDRRGGNASDQASLGGGGNFECRCARRRQEGLIVLFQIGSALR
jgi:hypothetical protein